MNTDAVKKSILFHWMYRIYITKEFDKSEFKQSRAVEILNMAGFKVPFDKTIKPFLDSVTEEFKEALKTKSVNKLLDKYPFPKIISKDGYKVEPTDEDLKKSIKNIIKDMDTINRKKVIKMLSEEYDFDFSDRIDELKELIVKVAEEYEEPEQQEPKEEEPEEEEKKSEPTSREIEMAIENIIEDADLDTLSNNMIIENLQKIFGVELTHRKKEIKELVNKVLTGEEEPKQEKKVKKTEKKQKTVKEVSRKAELEDIFVKLNKKAKDLKFYIEEEGKTQYVEEYNKVKKELLEVEDEIRSLIIPFGGDFGTNEGMFKRPEVEEKKQGNPFQKLMAQLSKPRVNPEEMPSEIKLNLKYIAFLTYYMISPLIAVEDPTLEDTYKLYPDLETPFRIKFANLSIKQRYEFIKSIINGRSFKKINELIENSEPVNPSENGTEISIEVSLQKFEQTAPNADDEIEYNFMYYVEPNKEFSKDVMVANIVNEIKRKTKSDEDIKSKVEKALGAASDKTSILEKVHTVQVANIKNLLTKQYNKLYSEDEDDMRNIQVHYEEVRPPLRFESMEEHEGRLPQTALLFSVSGSSEYRSDLLNIAKAMKNTAYETEIYKIKKDIESSDKFVDLKKSDRKEAEIKYIDKQVKKGELSQVAGNALRLFVSYYDTVSNLPSSTYERQRMFEYKRVEDLPEQYRPAAEKELRRRLAQLLSSHSSHLIEQKDALTKVQLEVNSPTIDIIAVADKINKLEASEEVKNKLLTKIQKEGKINVYIAFKQLSSKIKINPLIYHGFNRSKRERKTIEEMSELDRIKSSFPKSSHTINYCFTQLYLKPWLNLPRTFDYYIAHPMDLEKVDMSDKERFLYGEKLKKLKVKGYDNLYRPTTVFWRVYCTEFMMYRNDKYNCDMDKINKDLLNPKTRQYVIGIYDTTTNQNWKLLDKEDYQKECDWFENNDMGSLKTIDTISAIDLNKNIKMQKSARDNIRKQLKSILALVYNAHNISLKNENRLDLDSKKIEQALYEGATAQEKTIIYKYIFDSLNFLYLINPSSPLYSITSFFQRLLLTGSKSNYSNLVKLSKNIGEVIPELYLLDDKQSFLEIVESKIREDTVNKIKEIRIAAEPGFKFPQQPNVVTINYNEKINNKLASFDHSKFKNICVNYENVKDPFFVSQYNKEIYCVGKDDFYSIINGEQPSHLPSAVVEHVMYLIKHNKSDQLNRIFTMQYVADDYASKNFLVLYILKDIFDGEGITSKKDLEEFIEGSEDVQQAIKMVESDLGSKLSEQETELFINHLMSQGYNYFIKNIKEYIDTTEVSDELKEKLVNEYKKRYDIYSDEKIMNNDKAERLIILKDYINTLSNKYGDSLNEDVKEIVVDYFNTVHILPIVKGVKRRDTKFDEPSLLNNPFYQPSCNVCSKNFKQDDTIRTYLFKDGKKVLAEFCSTKCMEKVSEKEFEIPKDTKEMVLQGLIDKIIKPISLTYDELIQRTILIGMSLPKGISFIDAYVSWLSNKSFSDKVWLTYHHTILDKIAKHYNIKDDDVTELWRKLVDNTEFYSLFYSKLSQVAKPYLNYKQVSQEIYNPSCDYPLIDVDNWLLQTAQSLIPSNWLSHTFSMFSFEEAVFKPFFNTFNRCKNIVNSVSERKTAKSNNEFVSNIISYIGEYNPNELESLKGKIIRTAKKMNLKLDLDNIKLLLTEKLNIKKGSSEPLSKAIQMRMSSKGDHAPMTIIASHLNLDINDSSFSVESYRDLLLKVGVDFINKYISLMNAVDETISGARRKGRKLSDEYKVILKQEEKITGLKEVSAELSNKILNINKSIEDKKKSLPINTPDELTKNMYNRIQNEIKQLEKEMSNLKDKALELDIDIELSEDKLRELLSSQKSVKKSALPVQKKGVFRKLKEEEKKSVPKEDLTPVERRIQIENTLKVNLFNDIAKRLPDNFNLYNVAIVLGITKTSMFTADTVLTTKMLKEGKKKIDIENIEEGVGLSLEEEEANIAPAEPEALDLENLEEYVAEEEGDDEGLEGAEAEYGEEPAEEDYSY